MMESIESILEQIANFLPDQSEIIAAYLFGSHAHGIATALSDIDIATRTSVLIIL